MNILVCITHVPDTTSRIAFEEDNTKFKKDGVQFVIGPYDDYALARAVELKEETGGHVTVVNVGTVETEPTIRKALAIGADEAIRVDAEPKDSFFVAKQIAKVAGEKQYDLILMGRESIDFNSGVVHGMVGELLGMPSLSPVMTLDVKDGKAIMKKEIEGGTQEVEMPLPLVLGCQEPIAEWKIPNMRGIMTARSKPLNVVEAEAAEPVATTLKYELPPQKGDCKIFDKEDVTGLVKALRDDAKVL